MTYAARPGYDYPTGVTARGRRDADPVRHAITSLKRGSSRNARTAALCVAPIAARMVGEDRCGDGALGVIFDPEHPRACPRCADNVRAAAT